MELMDLWLLAPQCEDCACSEPFSPGLPDIHHDGWEVDLLLHVGPDALDRIQQERAEGSDFALRCKRCGRELRPWEDDDAYVVSYHLEEHYGIPLETPGQTSPPSRLRRKLFALYDSHCFGCRASDRDLHIDHIRPRSKGGDAAFRNLQPLCEECGNRKGDSDPIEVQVYSTIYFGPYPMDSYEGLFW
jgi:5-methylcytosine-specific restriction endonuclease McrA